MWECPTCHKQGTQKGALGWALLHETRKNLRGILTLPKWLASWPCRPLQIIVNSYQKNESKDWIQLQQTTQEKLPAVGLLRGLGNFEDSVEADESVGDIASSAGPCLLLLSFVERSEPPALPGDFCPSSWRGVMLVFLEQNHAGL